MYIYILILHWVIFSVIARCKIKMEIQYFFHKEKPARVLTEIIGHYLKRWSACWRSWITDRWRWNLLSKREVWYDLDVLSALTTVFSWVLYQEMNKARRKLWWLRKNWIDIQHRAAGFEACCQQMRMVSLYSSCVPLTHNELTYCMLNSTQYWT